MAPMYLKNQYNPQSRIFIIVGGYGSGKTEIAVNLACYINSCGKKVKLADLDIVNPYFRSREHNRLLGEMGIEVIMPPDHLQAADLPILVPEIKGMLELNRPDVVSIFDIGGDDVGARVLSAFKSLLQKQSYLFLQVINTRRPFTDTVEGCLNMKNAIEAMAKLKVNGVVVNSHLCADTTTDIILEGYRVATEFCRQTGLGIEFISVMAPLFEMPEIIALPDPILPLKRMNLPPYMVTPNVTRSNHPGMDLNSNL